MQDLVCEGSSKRALRVAISASELKITTILIAEMSVIRQAIEWSISRRTGKWGVWFSLAGGRKMMENLRMMG